MGHWLRWLIGCTVLAGVCGVVYWSRQTPVRDGVTHTNLPADDDPVIPQPPTNPGYLGPQVCAECHAERVAEFRATRHFQACALPSVETMPRGFLPGNGAHATHHPNLRFEMSVQDGRLIQTAIHKGRDGEERTSSAVAMVFGAGIPADEVYFTWHGNDLHELPAVWLHPLNAWGNAPVSPHGTGDFARPTLPRCMECHNTWFDFVPGTVNTYKPESFLLGVTCERCHGPGREHVDYHRAHPQASTAQMIAHPGRLSRERQVDLCAQCHSNAMRYRGPVFSYRPGDPLDRHFRTLTTRHPEEDRVANQTEYMLECQCYRKSDRMTCTTCHNPHRPAATGVAERSQSSCAKCHQPADCGERDRLPAAVRDNCVGCHMPQRTKVQVNFETAGDAYVSPVGRSEHRIAVYPDARDAVLYEWHRGRDDDHSRAEASRLANSLSAHWLSEGEAFRRDHRLLAAMDAYRQSLKWDPSPVVRNKLDAVRALQVGIDDMWYDAVKEFDEQNYPRAVELLTKILRDKPDVARAHGRLGTAYAVQGRRELAVKHLQAVAQYDPDDTYGTTMLAWLAYLDGRFDESLRLYRAADEVEPYHPKIHYQMGLALARLDRFAEAEATFRRVLEIDPNHALACQQLVLLHRRQKNPAAAIPFAKRAAKITAEKDPEVLMLLAETFSEAGRHADATETAASALTIAEADKPAIAREIKSRLREFRLRGSGK